jgi:single-strand DNA-binding protein
MQRTQRTIVVVKPSSKRTNQRNFRVKIAKFSNLFLVERNCIMAAFNKSVLVGNLTNDPECAEVGEKKTTKCNFRLAVNNPRNKEEVLYMNIAVWGKSAESCHKYLQKGSSVLVEGRIRQAKLENGSYWTEVVADTVQFLGKTKSADTASASTSQLKMLKI